MSSSINSTMSNLQEENQILQQELNKVEDLLATARAERDEMIIKFNALNDRVSGKLYIFIIYLGQREREKSIIYYNCEVYF